jgi:hypothetical protein
MDKSRLLFLLAKADEILGEMNEHLIVYISGGANMCLYVGSRASTHDIDAFPSDEKLLRSVSERMQALFQLPQGWFNPSGTLFVTEAMMKQATLGLDFNNLKVYFLAFDAMLVLKLLASRPEHEAFDLQDSIVLIQKLGIKNIDEIDALINKYKPSWNNAFVMSFAKKALELAHRQN